MPYTAFGTLPYLYFFFRTFHVPSINTTPPFITKYVSHNTSRVRWPSTYQFVKLMFPIGWHHRSLELGPAGKK